MKWLTMLALAGTIVGASGADAQGITIGRKKKPAAAAAQSANAAAAPALNTVAVYPFGSDNTVTQQSMVPVQLQLMQTALAVRGRMAFEANNVWTVVDRSSDAALQREIAKVHSPEAFNSAVRIKDQNQLNARYVLWGYVEQARVNQSTSGSNPTYDAHLTLVVRLINVETTKSDDKIIEVTSTPKTATQAAGQAGRAVTGRVSRGLTRWLDRKVSGNSSQGANTGPNPGMLPRTPDEALRLAYDNARLEMEKWAEEQATALGLGGAGSPEPTP